MDIEKIIAEIEELMVHYRDAELYGELFGLKTALEIVKREAESEHDKTRYFEERT